MTKNSLMALSVVWIMITSVHASSGELPLTGPLATSQNIAVPAGRSEQASGVRVRGHMKRIPVDTPPGTLFVILSCPGVERESLIGKDGAFEFSGILPCQATITEPLLEARALVVVGDHDIEGVELNSRLPGSLLLGQVVIDGGKQFHTGQENPLGPILRLRGRERTTGAVFSPWFIRSDGVLGIRNIAVGEYDVQVTLLPAGYSLKSMSYGGVDLLREPLKVSADENFRFLRVTLAPSANSPADPGATLIVSQKGQGPDFIEGGLTFFEARSTAAPGAIHLRRLGGEWCGGSFRALDGTNGCEPMDPLGFDSLLIPLPPGNYVVRSYVTANGECGGLCGTIGPPSRECSATVTLKTGETLYAERTYDSQWQCALMVSSKPLR